MFCLCNVCLWFRNGFFIDILFGIIFVFGLECRKLVILKKKVNS